ncbi:hypothetical protein ES703_74052 [subsurface metagenome]
MPGQLANSIGNIILADTFVNHLAQALRASFGSKGYRACAPAGDFGKYAFREVAGTHGAHGKLSPHPAQTGQQFLKMGIIGNRWAHQAQAFAVRKAFLCLGEQGVDRAEAHRSENSADQAEMTAP